MCEKKVHLNGLFLKSENLDGSLEYLQLNIF